MSDMTHKTVPVGPTRDTYLLNGMRFKMSFFEDEDGASYVTCFNNFEKELDGRWVALVAAEDDRHLEAAPPSPVTELEAMLYEALRAFRDGGPEGGTDFNGWHQSYEEPCRLAIEALAAYEAKKEGK